jgi:hypothetical protein
METDFFKKMNSVIDILFALDILISFRTTYQCPDTGTEVVEGCRIFKNYFFGRFIIDLVSTIPFDKIELSAETLEHAEAGGSSHYAVISCLKMIRVLRLQKLISHINASEDFKIQLLLFKMCFFLFLYIHFACCSWLFVSQ